MKTKMILAAFAVMLVTCSNFVGAMNISTNNEDVSSEKIILTEEELSKIYEFLNSIKDEDIKNKAEEIFKKIITEKGELDVNAVKKLTQNYYDIISAKISPFCKICDSKNNFLPIGFSSGTSTVFEPPYSNCYSWGDGTPGVDEYYYGCNKDSGGIGAFVNAWIGGSTAEAMQQLDFYVGRTKTVNIDAKIIRTGGKITFGFGAFSGTEKTWTWDDYEKNYHRADVDPWWSWDFIILKIIQIITLLSGYTPANIGEAIILINQIFSFKALSVEMQNMFNESNAEILDISFSFSASPGYHTIWVGLRASAAACITGTASAVTMGQVSKIVIDGIAAPEPPVIIGPSVGKVGQSFGFNVHSNDPNGDNIRYFFDWGDGDTSDWSEYLKSGSMIYESHSYSSKGTYDIKVITEDIDKMQSESVYRITVTEKSREKNLWLLQILKNLPLSKNLPILFFFLKNAK